MEVWELFLRACIHGSSYIYINEQHVRCNISELNSKYSYTFQWYCYLEKNKNFFDYINSYRVAEAKEKIAKEPAQTLLQIAYAVGFNSKNSFNSAFKKHVGMTPSAYRKKASVWVLVCMRVYISAGAFTLSACLYKFAVLRPNACILDLRV